MKEKLGQLPLFTPNSEWVTPDPLPRIPSDSVIGIDTETRDDGIESGLGPGWPFGLCRCIGISLAWIEGPQIKALYLPLRHPDSVNIPADIVKKYVQDILDRCSRVVGFNMAYDYPVLLLEGIVVDVRKIEDAYVCAALLSQNEFSYDLERCCEREGIPGKDMSLINEALVAYTGKPTSRGQLWRLPARYVGPYAEQDAVATLQLWHKLRPRIDENDIVGPYQTEIRLIEVTTAMRKKGIPIDVPRAEESRETLRQEAKNVLARMSALSGSEVNPADISSSKRLARHFDRVGVQYMLTRTGLPSFESGWLSSHHHAFPQAVAEYRQLSDLAEKFITNYLLGFTHNGHVHPEWSCLRDSEKGTRTGRLSSSNPPMQQIPGRKERASRIIRGVFVAPKGQVFLSGDYKAQEPRLAVNFGEALGAPGAFEVAEQYRLDPDTDLHGIGAKIIGIPRSSAKIIILGVMYGMMPKGMSIRLGCSEQEAKELYSRMMEAMPWLDALSKAVQKAARERGFIRLIDGARLFFDTWEPSAWSDREDSFPLKYEDALIKWPNKRIERAMTRKAFNYLIQGSAARQVKKAMVQCYDAGHTPLISLHDELDFLVDSQRASSEIQEIMITSTKLSIPVGVDAEHGITWGAANYHKYKTFDEAIRGEL